MDGMSSLYSFLESEYHIVIEAATDFISARQPSPPEAEKLGVPRTSPLLVVRRITHSGGRPVEVAILLIVAERYEYCVHTKERPSQENQQIMKLSAREIARLIDISAVQAPHGEAEIREMVLAARTHHFIAVHVLPCWVPFLRDSLAGSPDILVGAPVGFPGGGHRTEIKLAEARMLVQDGVQEMDMMLNVGKLRSGEDAYCREEIRAVVGAVKPRAREGHHRGPLPGPRPDEGRLRGCACRRGRLREDGNGLGAQRRHAGGGAVPSPPSSGRPSR